MRVIPVDLVPQSGLAVRTISGSNSTVGETGTRAGNVPFTTIATTWPVAIRTDGGWYRVAQLVTTTPKDTMKILFAASFVMSVIAFVIQAIAEANAADHATTSVVSPLTLSLGWLSTAIVTGIVARNWHTFTRSHL